MSVTILRGPVPHYPRSIIITAGSPVRGLLGGRHTSNGDAGLLQGVSGVGHGLDGGAARLNGTIRRAPDQSPGKVFAM